MPRGDGSPERDRGGARARSPFLDDPRMRELSAYFLDDLARRMDAIRAALDVLDARRLRAIAHELAGTAGGYGFAPVGDAARELEDRLRAASRATDASSAGDAAIDLADEALIADLRERTEDLLATCARALRTEEPR